MIKEKGVGGNEFHTHAILSAIEEFKNKTISVMNNVTTSNGNEEVLLKDEEPEDLCLIEEGAEVGDSGTEEVHLNEELNLVMDQRQKATQRRVMEKRNRTMVFHHGCLQVLPLTWLIQIITCKQLIDNWYDENNRENIPLLELLSALYVAHLGTTGKRNSGKLKLR